MANNVYTEHMYFSTFRDQCETLGRFASVRENAKEPTDRIVIQAYDGVLKLVAGAKYGTVIVTCGETSANGMAVVAARPLLSAAKTLRGKGTVDFTITARGARMQTSMGGEVALDNVTSEVPDLIRPSTPTLTVGVSANWWPGVVKVLTACSAFAHGGWEQVGFRVTPYGTFLSAGDAFVRADVPLSMLEAPFHGAIDPDFISALRGVDEASTVGWNDTSFMVDTRSYRFVTHFMAGWPAVPEAKAFVPNVSVTMPRASLADMLKGVALPDKEFGRVILTASGDVLVATSWSGGQRIKVPASVDGAGTVGVVAERLAKVITAIGGQRVTIEWCDTESGAIRVTGDGWPWEVLVARVALA